MRRISSILFTIILLSLPVFLHAQEALAQPNLSMAIKSAILSDPRSVNLSSGQIDAIVASLSAQAAEQGMTEADIYWRPTLEQTLDAATAGQYASDDCGAMPRFVCSINRALDFNGADKTPFITGVVTIALILGLLAFWVELRHRRKLREQL